MAVGGNGVALTAGDGAGCCGPRDGGRRLAGGLLLQVALCVTGPPGPCAVIVNVWEPAGNPPTAWLRSPTNSPRPCRSPKRRSHWRSTKSRSLNPGPLRSWD
jgi:hypothetical protein